MLIKIDKKSDLEDNIKNNKIDLNEYKYLAYLDIDDLAMFNAIYGHQEADKQLEKIEKIIKNNFDSNIISRWAGDEFLILFKENNDNLNKLKYVQTLINDETIRLDKESYKQYVKYFSISISYIENINISTLEDLNNIIQKALQNIIDKKCLTNPMSQSIIAL